MKKIILLTFILFLNQAWGSSMPTSYYSTTNYAVMNSVITSTLMTTIYLSEHNRNRVYRKLNQCIKYKGGDACFKKFGIKENKLTE